MRQAPLHRPKSVLFNFLIRYICFTPLSSVYETGRTGELVESKWYSSEATQNLMPLRKLCFASVALWDKKAALSNHMNT